MADSYGLQMNVKAFVNEVAQKTDDMLMATVTQFLTDKGYETVYEINGANVICAIEKQIPKKPVPKKFMSIEYPQCPVCNRVLFASEKYCATCGQAIDRGE